MKKTTFSLLVGLIFILSTFVFYACEEDVADETGNIVPENFSVDIPPSLSASASGSRILEEELSGAFIYEGLRIYIAIGENSAKIISEIMKAIALFGLGEPQTFTFTSNDDNREKSVVITDNATADNRAWSYGMTITDTESTDTAMQVFWNTDPIKGIAIINPYQMNRTEDSTKASARYMVEYDESGSAGYDQHMIVKVAHIPQEDPNDDWYVSSLKMFVGKTGDIVEVYGNSNHPDARFDSTETVGKNYAFVARSNEALDIAIAKVALPPSDLATDEDSLFADYSIKAIFESIGLGTVPHIDPPGYFTETGGFVSSGDSIPDDEGFTTSFVDLSSLRPFVPKDITDMVVKFQ